MKRYIGYFSTLLLVLIITDFSMGGGLLRFGEQSPEDIPARLSSVNLTKSIVKEPEETEPEGAEAMGEFIGAKSCAFVEAAFSGDKAGIKGMLFMGTEYIVSEDRSSYIRYTSEDLHVEGYMATDRKLVQVRQSWYVREDEGTITSGVEVEIEGEELVQTWYIHYRKVAGQWKIFMLENGL